MFPFVFFIYIYLILFRLNKILNMKKMLVFWLLMACQVICCIALSLISPFFPPYAEEKGISSEVVGFIFSANPIGAVTASMVLGKILNQVTKLNLKVLG
jgi:MFS family permease